MALETKSQEKFLSDMVATWAQILGLIPVLQRGSFLRAVFEAIIVQLTFQQYQVESANAYARVQTSVGPDVDSWMGQFVFPRLPAEKAVGAVTMSLRSAKSTVTLIPLGMQVQTLEGTQVFEVVKDTTKTAWNAEQGAYIIPIGSLSADVQVQALLPGGTGNVQPGKVVQIISSGNIDLVNNANALSGGREPETDDEFRQRFVLFINSRSRATRDAYLEAAISVRAGLDVRLVENTRPNGTFQPGFNTVIIDDGTGAPSSQLIQVVTQAIERIRGAGIEFVVVGPTTNDVEVSQQIQLEDDAFEEEVTVLVQKALSTYVNGLKIGQSLYLAKLISITVAVPGVKNVSPNSTLINGEEEDFVISPTAVIRAPNDSVDITIGEGEA